MAINTQKVVVGGLAAGVVIAAIDFVVNGVLLADQNEAAMNAPNPGLMANLEGGSFIATMVVLSLAWGLLIAFTYAAMRPRFGEGPKTALIAGAQIWCVAALMMSFFTAAGMFTWGYFVTGGLVGIVETVIGAQVAGVLYSEA